MKPLYMLTRDELAAIFSNPAIPVGMRNAASREFDAKTDSIEDR